MDEPTPEGEVEPKPRPTTLEDPILSPYRDLKDRHVAARAGRFIAEGAFAVGRLLMSDLRVESVLLSRKRADGFLAANAQSLARRPSLSVCVVDDEQVHRLVGFEHHSGVLACGFRPELPDSQRTLEELLGRAGGSARLLVAPELTNHENVGAVIRTAAAFGCAALLLSERCCDPFYRRSVRVSMGAVFFQPILICEDLRAVLLWLKQRWQVRLIASVCQDGATPLPQLRPARWSDRPAALLIGEEAQGLHRRWLELSDERVTIPMQRNTDSLNVNAAAAVCLYQLCCAGA